VTVHFSDMKGFSGLLEHFDPEALDSLMAGVFSRFEAIVRAHGDEVEKYIGDAMVAIFGYPTLHEDDPVRAVEAALEIAAVLEHPERVTARGGDGHVRTVHQPLSFRTRVHSALAAMGKWGGQDVVTGHGMAVAARLQAAAPEGGILVPEAVRDRYVKRFLYGVRQALELKGLKDLSPPISCLGD
jgi:class 3 adenylate cyclase